jgi:hypothetical protein
MQETSVPSFFLDNLPYTYTTSLHQCDEQAELLHYVYYKFPVPKGLSNIIALWEMCSRFFHLPSKLKKCGMSHLHNFVIALPSLSHHGGLPSAASKTISLSQILVNFARDRIMFSNEHTYCFCQENLTPFFF